MHEKGIYSSDVKDENIVFWYDYLQNVYKPKLIDFGHVVQNFLEVFGYTSHYFINGKNRTEETIKQKLFQFKSPDERVKAEIHCLAITALDLLLLSKKIAESEPNLSE